MKLAFDEQGQLLGGINTAGEEQDAQTVLDQIVRYTKAKITNKPNDQGVVGRNAEEIYDQGTYQKEENTQRTTTYYTNQRSIYGDSLYLSVSRQLMDPTIDRMVKWGRADSSFNITDIVPINDETETDKQQLEKDLRMYFSEEDEASYGLKFFMYGRVMSHYSKDCGLVLAAPEDGHKDTQVCALMVELPKLGEELNPSDEMTQCYYINYEDEDGNLLYIKYREDDPNNMSHVYKLQRRNIYTHTYKTDSEGMPQGVPDILQNIEPDATKTSLALSSRARRLSDHALFANKAAWMATQYGKDMWKSRICLVEGDPKDAVYSAPTNSEDIPHLRDLDDYFMSKAEKMTQLTPVFETRTDSESKEASLLRWESQTIKYAVVHEAYATIKGNLLRDIAQVEMGVMIDIEVGMNPLMGDLRNYAYANILEMLPLLETAKPRAQAIIKHLILQKAKDHGVQLNVIEPLLEGIPDSIEAVEEAEAEMAKQAQEMEAKQIELNDRQVSFQEKNADANQLQAETGFEKEDRELAESQRDSARFSREDDRLDQESHSKIIKEQGELLISFMQELKGLNEEVAADMIDTAKKLKFLSDKQAVDLLSDDQDEQETPQLTLVPEPDDES